MSLVVDKLLLRRGTFTVAVDHLEIPPGTIGCLRGRSGSGKSTVLDAIAGFLPVEAGTIRAGGLAVEHLPPERRRIAAVFQRAALFPHLTVRDNLSFALRVRGVARAERDAIAERWLVRLGLSGLGDRASDAVSGGQAQRVALGRAFVAGFPVLLLDEPFNGLDDETRSELHQLLERLVREEKVSALLVTHDRRDVEALADSCWLVENGVVSRSNSP